MLRASGHNLTLSPLLLAAWRRPAVVLLAVCLAVAVFLGVRYAGHTQPGRLDSAVDGRLQAWLPASRLVPLTRLGTTGPVTLMTAALVVACLLTRRWLGAALALVSVPAAGALTEFILKPVVDRTLHGWLSYPSGHATSMFALAMTCIVLLVDPPRRKPSATVRVLLALCAVALAIAVATAMVVLGLHYFTDAIGGTAVGIATVLTVTLLLDQAAARARPRANDARSHVSAEDPRARHDHPTG
jgi:membrane-associated phospholipid phosphatase